MGETPFLNNSPIKRYNHISQFYPSNFVSPKQIVNYLCHFYKYRKYGIDGI